MQQYRVGAEDARSELSVVLIKMQSLESQLRESNNNLVLKKMELQQAKIDSDVFKENNARQASLIKSLRESLSLADSKTLQLGTELSEKANRLSEAEKQSELANSVAESLRRSSANSQNELSVSHNKMKDLCRKLVEMLGKDFSAYENGFPGNIDQIISLMETEMKKSRDSISQMKSFQRDNEKLNRQITRQSLQLQNNKESYKDLEEKYVWACQKLEDLNALVMEKYRDVLKKSEVPHEMLTSANNSKSQDFESSKEKSTVITDALFSDKGKISSENRSTPSIQRPKMAKNSLTQSASPVTLKSESQKKESSKFSAGSVNSADHFSGSSYTTGISSARQTGQKQNESNVKPFSSARSVGREKPGKIVQSVEEEASGTKLPFHGNAFPSAQIRKPDDPPYKPSVMPKKYTDLTEG